MAALTRWPYSYFMPVEIEANPIMEEGDRRPQRPGRAYSILHVVLSISETNAPYNDHCLPLRSEREIAICTYFRPSVTVPEQVTLFAGDDTLLGFIRSLSRALRGKHYDVIHAHTQHVAFLFILLNALTGWQFMAQTIFTIHSSYPLYKLRNKLLLLPVFAFFRAVVCCSYASRDCVPRYLQWLAGSRLHVVENCLDLDRLDRAIAGYPRQHSCERFCVIAVGRLIESKDPLTVLNAFRQSANEDSRLVFVGDGNYCETLIHARRSLGLSTQVELTGLIGREAVYQRLNRADLFVSASLGEGLPLAVLQAMACSCPVVLSDIAPHREIAMGASFIPLVPVHDVEGFAREIKRFREMGSEARARIGELCRALVEQRFPLKRMHEGYGALYADLINAGESCSMRCR